MVTKQFPLVDVVMLYDGRMFYSGPGLSGMMRLADFMTNDSVFLHNLGDVATECKPYLLDQYPWLAQTAALVFDKSKGQADVDRQGREYIAALETQYGTMLDIAPMPMDDHTIVDPQESLAQRLRDAGRNPEDVMLTIDISEDDEDDSYGEINWK